ncbi:MAG: hypothetical protein HY675_08660 [Chloroflexi bacterium]|nr:hypothetical protein [Chloroflexota bacterium]
MRPIGRFLARLSLSFLGLLVAVGLLEVALQLYPAVPAARLRAPSEACREVATSPVSSYDPYIGFRGVPGSSGEFSKTCEYSALYQTTVFRHQFAYNSEGWRDTSHAYEKPAGVTRIVVLGDSFSWGYGVAQSDAYPALLPALLRGEGVDTEVITMAMPGWGPNQELVALTYEGLRYKPDVVVVQFAGNDYADSLCASFEERSSPQFYVGGDGELKWPDLPLATSNQSSELQRPDLPVWMAEEDKSHCGKAVAKASTAQTGPSKSDLTWLNLKRWLERHSISYRLVRDSVKSVRLTQTLAEAGGVTEPAQAAVPKPARAVALVKALLETIKRTSEANGAAFVLLTAPLYQSTLRPADAPTEDQALISEFSGHALDLTHAFRNARISEPRKAFYFAPEDGHWTAAGHRLAAHELARHLRELLNATGTIR